MRRRREKEEEAVNNVMWFCGHSGTQFRPQFV